jgi:hypothetical protein
MIEPLPTAPAPRDAEARRLAVHREDGEPDYKHTLRQARAWVDESMRLHHRQMWARAGSCARVSSTLSTLAESEHAVWINEQMMAQQMGMPVELMTGEFTTALPAEDVSGTGYLGGGQ